MAISLPLFQPLDEKRANEINPTSFALMSDQKYEIYSRTDIPLTHIVYKISTQIAIGKFAVYCTNNFTRKQHKADASGTRCGIDRKFSERYNNVDISGFIYVLFKNVNDCQRSEICRYRFGESMHELGVLRHVVKTVSGIAQKNRIRLIRHIALEVGEESGFVPLYLKKLFPVAADAYPLLQKAELRISMVPGRSLMIKEIGY